MLREVDSRRAQKINQTTANLTRNININANRATCFSQLTRTFSQNFARAKLIQHLVLVSSTYKDPRNPDRFPRNNLLLSLSLSRAASSSSFIFISQIVDLKEIAHFPLTSKIL